MHDKNGLSNEVLEAWGNMKIGEVDEMVFGWLRQHGVKSHDVLLCGSGVAHFDRRFIRKYMPRLELYLAYPAGDIGAVRRFFQMWGMEVPMFKDSSHRAMSDVQAHLAEARWYKTRIEELREITRTRE
jgi:oligoribonuclease